MKRNERDCLIAKEDDEIRSFLGPKVESFIVVALDKEGDSMTVSSCSRPDRAFMISILDIAFKLELASATAVTMEDKDAH